MGGGKWYLSFVARSAKGAANKVAANAGKINFAGILKEGELPCCIQKSSEQERGQLESSQKYSKKE